MLYVLFLSYEVDEVDEDTDEEIVGGVQYPIVGAGIAGVGEESSDEEIVGGVQ
jgi:hypothetical protein